MNNGRVSNSWVLALAALSSLAAEAATYQVGPSRAYHSLSSLPALAPGDLVEIDPATYHEVRRWTRPGSASNPIIVRGVGAARPVFDATGQTVTGVLPNPRAVFQIEADWITVENIEFKNARNGDNGAGIRVTGANNVTVRNCKITTCDMGMMCDHNSALLVESCEIASNGTPLYDGYSHNLYLGGNSATLKFCYIHDALNGQNFKTRGHYTELLYNYIADSQDGEVGMVDAAETAQPNSHAVMIGNIVVSKPRLPGYNSGRFILFGQDSGGAHNGTLYACNNTFVAGDGRIQFLSANAGGASIFAANNIFFGSGQILGAPGGGVVGSNNWLGATATAPSTFLDNVRGSDPGFVDGPARNYHLLAASACRNRGLNLLTYLDGAGASHSGIPAFEYINHLQSHPRSNGGSIDIGACQYAPPLINGIRTQGTDCLISIAATAGDQYELQESTDLGARTWIPIVSNILGSDNELEVRDTNALSRSKGYYRLKADYF